MTTLTTKFHSDPAKPLYTLDFTKAHQVYRNEAGKRVPGVTTIIGMLDKPALIHWAWKLGMDGIDYKKSSGVACDIGTIAHALCECHVRGMQLDYSNLPPDMVAKAENAFIKFLAWWDSNQLTCEASELQMVSERLQTGGTADIVAVTPSGERWLVDLKTSKAIYREHKLQTAGAYAPIYEESTGNTIDKVFIVRIGKEDEGDFEAVEVDKRKDCEAAFEALRTCYELLKPIK